jgi:hypothetical protein
MIISGLIAALALGQQANPACVPTINEGPTKAGDYVWLDRHQAVLDVIKSGEKHEFALIGDSITHGWGGNPMPNQQWKGHDPEGYDALFGPYHPINMGFGWDQTGHVLWRIQHGELDGFTAKGVIVAIGTNNIGWHTNEQVFGGIVEVVNAIRVKQPSAKILVLGILPREVGGNVEDIKKVSAINGMLASNGWHKGVTYADTGKGFLDENGRVRVDLMPDKLHPNKEGYEVWGRAIEPVLRKMMGE